MAESEEHIFLVRMIEEYAAKSHPLRQVLSDAAPELGGNRPPTIGDFIPDVYCPIASGLPLLIGEAKTVPDLMNEHTKKQIAAYLRHLKGIGKGTLCIATRWDYVQFVCNSLRQCKIAMRGLPIECVVLGTKGISRQLVLGDR